MPARSAGSARERTPEIVIGNGGTQILVDDPAATAIGLFEPA
jgi:hypothetical protein